MLAYAVTIHKIQGITAKKTIVDIGKNEKPSGLTYVALSRVRKLEDLLIEYFGLERLEKLKLPDYIIEYDKLSERLAKETLKKFGFI